MSPCFFPWLFLRLWWWKKPEQASEEALQGPYPLIKTRKEHDSDLQMLNYRITDHQSSKPASQHVPTPFTNEETGLARVWVRV